MKQMLLYLHQHRRRLPDHSGQHGRERPHCNFSITQSCQLGSQPEFSHHHGMGKTLVRPDLEKLKVPKVRDGVLKEKALQLNWNLLCQNQLHNTGPGMSAMGRFMIRTMLFLTKKQSKGREDHEYKTLEEISTVFGEEVLAFGTHPKQHLPQLEPPLKNKRNKQKIRRQHLCRSDADPKFSTQCWGSFKLYRNHVLIYAGHQ